MNMFRLFLVVFAFFPLFLSIESAWATCHDSTPPGTGCCFAVSGRSGLTEPARPTDSLDQCKIFARQWSDREAQNYYGCPIPGIQRVIESGTRPDGLEYYVIRSDYWFPDGRPCGATNFDSNWVWNPPPPPPPVACSIPDLIPLPATADACTRSLEDNRGVPGTDCPSAPVMTRPLGHACWQKKVATVGVAYPGTTATLRTDIYNQHLLAVWKLDEQHTRLLITDPDQYYACAIKRAAVDAEMAHHKIRYKPANKSNHVGGRAFDNDETFISKLEVAGHYPTDMLNTATIDSPACTLFWGGEWKGAASDPIHFQLNVP